MVPTENKTPTLPLDLARAFFFYPFVRRRGVNVICLPSRRPWRRREMCAYAYHFLCSAILLPIGKKKRAKAFCFPCRRVEKKDSV